MDKTTHAPPHRIPRSRLHKIYWQNYLGTMTDVLSSVIWSLIISWHPIAEVGTVGTAMLGFLDVIWVCFSAIYYGVRSATLSLVPQYMAGRSPDEVSRPLKNAAYLIYGILLPFCALGLIFTPELMEWLNAPDEHIWLYINAMRVNFLGLLTVPTYVISSAYLKATFQNRKGALLDGLINFGYITLSAIAVFLFKQGPVVMIAIYSSTVLLAPIYVYFRAPIKGFFKKGWELDLDEIKTLVQISKWELIRRLSPRVINMLSTASLMALSPVLVAGKMLIGYAFQTISAHSDAASTTSLTEISHNVGYGEDDHRAYDNLNHIWFYNMRSMLLMGGILFLTRHIWVNLFTPDEAVQAVITDPWLWALFTIEQSFKSRYYALLSIARTLHKEYLAFFNSQFAIIGGLMSTVGLVFFINTLGWSIYGMFLANAIASTLHGVLAELYLIKKGLHVQFWDRKALN